MVLLLMPVALVVGAFLLTMNSRSGRLVSEIAEEQAFQAAEAGVDAAIFAARIGTLTSGVNLGRSLSNGSRFLVEPSYLGADGLDNDGDTFTDEADEDLFQIIVSGWYRQEKRRLAAYLGRTSFLPSIESAVAVTNPLVTIDINGTTELTGTNYNLNGTLGDPSKSTDGLSISSPGTTSDLLGELTPVEQGNVTGVNPTPSLGVRTPLDLTEVVEEARNAASIVLTNSMYANRSFGDPPPGTGAISFRDGDVTFTGNVVGAGLMVVTGNLRINGNFRYDGVVIVLGDIYNGAGTMQINGGLLQGPTAADLTLRGTTDVRFSMEGIGLANDLTGRYVAFNGWQEISRN